MHDAFTHAFTHEQVTLRSALARTHPLALLEHVQNGAFGLVAWRAREPFNNTNTKHQTPNTITATQQNLQRTQSWSVCVRACVRACVCACVRMCGKQASQASKQASRAGMRTEQISEVGERLLAVLVHVRRHWEVHDKLVGLVDRHDLASEADLRRTCGGWEMYGGCTCRHTPHVHHCDRTPKDQQLCTTTTCAITQTHETMLRICTRTLHTQSRC